MPTKTQVILTSLALFSIIGLLAFYDRLPHINIHSSIIFGIRIEQRLIRPACIGQPTIIRRNAKNFNLTEVHTTCTLFLDRVREYNLALDILRNETLRARKPEEWHGRTEGNATVVIRGAEDNFLEQLGIYPEIETVVLPWMGTTSENWSSLVDYSNMMIQNYYEWTVSDQLCKWIETPGTIKMKYDVTFNRTCNRYINNTIKPQSLKPVFLHMKPVNTMSYWPNEGKIFPAYFYQRPTSYVFYMQIIPDAILPGWGDVYGPNVKFVPYGCSDAKNPKLPNNVKNQILYDEVFVIDQYWGTAVFHRMAEIVPRLGSSLDFLKRNPQIKIYAPEGKGGRLAEIVKILGLDPDRLITAWGRAKIAYVPRVSYCGMPSLQESQIIASLYHKHIERVLGAYPRNRLILIRRSGMRRFTQQLEIEKVVEGLAKEYGLVYQMFIDNPVPTFNQTMRMFHSAVMVIAPHGAGLANMLFSLPGTFVIEGVCNLGSLNLCFQKLAVILGHHYHAIPGRGGCEGVVDVPASDIEETARTYLQLYKLSKRTS